MIYIIDRIREHGGEVIRDQWRFRLRPGRLTPNHIAWVKDHKDELYRDLWPEFDAWKERTASNEGDGMPRAEAEAAAYADVMRSRC